MHKLDRGAPPDCLAAFKAGQDAWDHTIDRVAIWNALDQMQGGRCAYCECQLTAGDRHIEHFRQRHRYPQGTFEWGNLFGSCSRQDSCGKHKDGCGPYAHADLIKPDDEDPDLFFVFVSDGTIALRSGIQAQQRHRAAETLRIFNLDAEHGPLRHMRHAAAVGYLQTAEEFQRFAAAFPESEWRPLLQQEIDAIAHLPFTTAIRHTLLGNR